MLVTKEFAFDAAHNLPKYRGRCERLHGHTWRMQVTVERAVQRDGMAFDFVRLKEIVESRVVGRLDHGYINDLLPLASAEHVAMWAWEQLCEHLPLREIRIWETPNSFVTYRGELEPLAEIHPRGVGDACHVHEGHGRRRALRDPANGHAGENGATGAAGRPAAPPPARRPRAGRARRA